MNERSFVSDSIPFLEFLQRWIDGLPAASIEKVMPSPERTAILSVDVINGFCYEGPLASPRVARIVQPIRDLFQAAWGRGVRDILLIQDTHEPAAVEFQQWPAHCVRGTTEAEAVPEFKQLPFYDRMVTLQKNSINAAYNTGLEAWLDDHPQTDTFIVVGDCTDLCTYQLAMFARLQANAHQRSRRVIVPADCVDTYDLPVEAAQEIGAQPHPAELLHAVFLYHMALNGVEVVKGIRTATHS